MSSNKLVISRETAEKILSFRNERNWSQFHNPKDLAISISLEAAELLECFRCQDLILKLRANTKR